MSARLSRGFSLCPEGANSPDPHSLWCEKLPCLRRFVVTQFRLSAVIIWMPVLCVRHVREAECAIGRLFTQAE